jgi:hypothetical protein
MGENRVEQTGTGPEKLSYSVGSERKGPQTKQPNNHPAEPFQIEPFSSNFENLLVCTSRLARSNSKNSLVLSSHLMRWLFENLLILPSLLERRCFVFSSLLELLRICFVRSMTRQPTNIENLPVLVSRPARCNCKNFLVQPSRLARCIRDAALGNSFHSLTLRS